MVNRFLIILIAIAFVGCGINDPSKLLENGNEDFLNNKVDYEYLIRILDELSIANNSIDSRLFIQSKQYHIDYSERNDEFYEFKKAPIVFPSRFIRVANKLGIDDVWLNANYYKLRQSENYSFNFKTSYIYFKNEDKRNNDYLYSKNIDDKWLVVVVKNKN